MDTYVKKVKIQPTLDLSNFKKAVEEIPEDVKKAAEEVKKEVEKVGDEVKKQTDKTKKELKKSPFKKAISDFSSNFRSSFKEEVFGKNLNAEELGKNFGESLGNALSNQISKWTDSLKNFLIGERDSVLSEFKDLASYSLSTSLKVNQSARDMALEYGLSDKENYAYAKTSKEMGISSVEDLYYLTPAQQERFAERIGYYSGKYEELANKDFFRNYEEYMATMSDFKEDLKMSIVQFIVENKDTIMNVMNFLMKATEVIMNTIAGIARFLSVKPTEAQTSSAISDSINNYSNSSKVTTVKVDNSFNGISLNDQTTISQSVQRANEQLIQALNGTLG